MKKGVRAAGVLFLLFGCTVAEPDLSGRLLPSAAGIDVAGTALEIGFGRSFPGAVDAASRLIGQAPSDRRSEDGCEVARWGGGFEMHARDGAFVGWRDARAGASIPFAGALCRV